jgi:hypothetical protein
MNEMIILGIVLLVFGAMLLVYGAVAVAYYKFVLKSDKSIGQILSEI